MHDEIDPVVEIEAGLRTVMAKGLPVEPTTAPAKLLEMRGVQARAIDARDFLSRLKALNELLHHILERSGDSAEGEALQILFALRGSERGTTLTLRRTRARLAGGWHYDERHFRRNIEPKLLRQFGLILHSDSLNYTPRTQYAPMPVEISGDTPRLSSADANEQEELVSRIWALVYELRAELIHTALIEASNEPDQRTLERSRGTAVWVVARLLSRIHEYLEAYGDRILQGDAEFRAEGLIRLAGWRGDLGDREATRMRYAIAKVGSHDRDAFIEEINNAASSG